MAKKKEETLTLKEKLEQALVPVEEQPYEVPGNWCWLHIGDINKYNSKIVNPNKLSNDIYELYSVPSSMENYPEICSTEEIGSSKQSVIKGDVLLCKINPKINRVWLVEQYTNNILLASSEWVVIRNANLYSQYLMWCLRTKYFRKYMLSNVSGVGGSLMRAQPKFIANYPIPIPPLLEQQRIVVCIESLFAKLDEAKEKVQAVLDASENRKAAILHSAFSGELTKKWRRISKLPISKWNENTLDSVCKSIFDGDHMPPPKADDGIPFLVISNINTGYLSFANTRFVQKEYYNGLKDTRKPEKGDILYTIVGSIGIPVMVNTEREFCFQRHIALLKPKSIYPKYLWYLLQTSEMYSSVLDIATGTAQLTVPIKGLRELTIRYPSIEEQNEIVISLDGLLTKENKMVEIANHLMVKIDLIKKSILAKAFRGELGTNDISEPSSIELLKEILK